MANKPKSSNGRKRINLALQGGGAHGAFTWGVLDRLFEDGRLDVVGCSGTSAGAMNSAVMAYGLTTGGFEGAREVLGEFWRKTGEAAKTSPLKPTPLDKALSPGNMDFSPFWLWYDSLSRLMSPYQLNPLGFNPLLDVLNDIVDFERLRQNCSIQLFICATNVKTGRIRVFRQSELTVHSILASACLPYLFHAVEVDGEYYWDGGFMGNPPIYPLIYHTDCEDVLIVQINPINIADVPQSANEILDRMNELSFNSSLMREMRAIGFVTRLLEEKALPRDRYKQLKIHTVDAEMEMAALSHSSKLNADAGFLKWLFDLGREKGDEFLAQHFDKIGKESSTNIEEKFF